MDVTNGLISRLVKSKSTERVLAPIASQVSLLMILKEVEVEESADGSALNVSACVERVTQAVDGFIRVGQDQIHRSSDTVFDSQMQAACETLELAKSQLYVAGQSMGGQSVRGSATHTPRSHTHLIQAAKDLLQAILRVLIIVDDVEVRRCVQAVSVVEDKVRNVCSLNEAPDLVSAFKELTEAMLYMTMMVSRRQKDLVSEAQRERLVTGLGLIRKGVSSLRMSVQTHLKYPNNAQAQVGKLQVLDQAVTSLGDLRAVLESGPPSDLEAEEAGHFVQFIDQVLEGLEEGNRYHLSADLEVWVASIVRHAMEVAHLSQGTYRHLITRTCQRILQSKFRLFELQEAMAHCPNLSDVRVDYDAVCEALLDELCELEKHVNMALLNVIVDTACFTSQPLEQLASLALHPQEDTEAGSDLGEEFISHGDRLCQVAAMASGSSMDPKKVRTVRLVTSRMEQLMPEVLPAVGAVARDHGDVAAVRHLKGIVQEWCRETEALVQSLDSMTDPAVTLHVTEQRMRQGVNVVRGKVCERDREGARGGLRRLLAHASRMAQVTTRVIDHSASPLYRNGLRVFVHQLQAARKGVKEASQAVLGDLSHARLVDTLHRRLGLLLDAAADVRQGIKGDNHVDVLNPARQNVYRRQTRMPAKPARAGGGTRTNSEACTQNGNNCIPRTAADSSLSAGGNTTTGCTEPPPRQATTATTTTTTQSTTVPHTTTTTTQSPTVPHTTTTTTQSPTVPHTTTTQSPTVPHTTISTPVQSDAVTPTAVTATDNSSPSIGAEIVRAAVPNYGSAVSTDVAPTGTEAGTNCLPAVPAAVAAAATTSDRGSAVPAEEARGESGQRERTGGQKGDDRSSRCEASGQQKGETSCLVEGVGDGVVVSAMRGDKGEVARWNGDVLGWTSHLGEVALSVLNHCHHASRKTEMQQLISEVDRLAPVLMEAARFVSVGDRGQTDTLRLLADDWVNACRRLVIMVDVAAGDWLLLMDSVLQAVTDHDTTTLKALLSTLDRNQREMNQLLTRAKRLEGKHVAGGSDIVQFFQDAHPELDSLTATLKTTADCLATTEHNNTVSQTQLIQRGREWCVLMACVVSRLDCVADALSTAGQSTLGVLPPTSSSSLHTLTTTASRPQAGTHSKLVPVLQAETARLKSVLASLTAGSDAVVKKRSEDLSQGLSDLVEEVVEIAQTPVDDVTLPQAQLFARLDAGLARSRWTEKAIEAVQFVHRHCHRYSVLITNLLYSTALPGPVDGVPQEVRQLQARMKAVSQRTLLAIQLSSDLQQRANVRRCLDDLVTLLPSIAEAATDYLSGIGGETGAREVRRFSLQWGAKVHCLLSTLRAMADIKVSAINELERQLSAQSAVETLAPTTPAAPPTPTPRPPAYSSSSSGGAHPSVNPHTPLGRLQSSPLHRQPAGSPRQRGTQAATPPSAASRRESPGTPARPDQSISVDDSGTSTVPMSPYRRSALYTSWLASAQYLGEEVAGWGQDADNGFVQLMTTMAQHCYHMLDFVRGGTSLKDSEEVANTGLSLAASGRELEKFARSLLAMCPHHGNAADLQKATDRISTYSNQLHIVATVLYNAPGHPQGDCILARNAANLVDAVRHMFSISEGIAVAGGLTPREGSETDRQVVDLLSRWQHKLAAYHSQQTRSPPLDELGLRRMELHNPPSLTSLLDP